MTTADTRCWILPLRASSFPVEADKARMAFAWDDATIAERLSHGLDVAPGVRIAILSMGDHWQPELGENVYGALVAVRTTGHVHDTPTRCQCGWRLGGNGGFQGWYPNPQAPPVIVPSDTGEQQ
jgi:hypothetical protein